jgi:hypothetical protein
VAAAAPFGRWQFERGLRYDPPPAGADVRGQARVEPVPVPSLWSRPLAAIVKKELRSLARTPRFRTVFIMGFTSVAVWFRGAGKARRRLVPDGGLRVRADVVRPGVVLNCSPDAGGALYFAPLPMGMCWPARTSRR